MGSAASSTMAGFITDTAATEVGACVAKATSGQAGPAKAERFAIGGKHCVLTFSGWGKFHGGFSCDGDFRLAVCW